MSHPANDSRNIYEEARDGRLQAMAGRVELRSVLNRRALSGLRMHQKKNETSSFGFKNKVMEATEPFNLQCYCVGGLEILQH